MRTYGVLVGVLTFVLDAFKGVLGALLGSWIAGYVGMLVGAVFVVAGHNWSFLLHFNGGKGAATSYGAMLTIFPLWTAVGILVFLIVLLATGYASLGSICTFLFVFLMILIVRPMDVPLVIAGIILVAMALYRHRGNIKRLFNGTENKINLWRRR